MTCSISMNAHIVPTLEQQEILGNANQKGNTKGNVQTGVLKPILVSTSTIKNPSALKEKRGVALLPSKKMRLVEPSKSTTKMKTVYTDKENAINVMDKCVSNVRKTAAAKVPNDVLSMRRFR